MKSRRARVGLSIFLVSNSNQTLSFDTFHKDLCHNSETIFPLKLGCEFHERLWKYFFPGNNHRACHFDGAGHCCSGSYGIWDDCSECFCHATEDSDNLLLHSFMCQLCHHR